MIDTSKISYIDSYENNDCDTITWYFDGPASLIHSTCPNISGTNISLECPRKHREGNYAFVLISPVIRNPDGSERSYDRQDWNIPYEDIEKILDLIPAEAK